MARLVRCILTIVGLVLLILPPVHAGQISLTFDEKQLADDNNDPILNFYNGGETFLGKGPGPTLGVVFADSNARVYTTPQTGHYTPPGYMLVSSDNAATGQAITTTMNVSGGFISSVNFDYAVIGAAGSLQVFSGLDGTGSVLGTTDLPVTSSTGNGVFVADSVEFSGIAHSVVFDGGNKQLAVDDILLNSVPEPPGLHLVAFGMAFVCVKLKRCCGTRVDTTSRR
jgi:hypothetical protein